MEKTMSVDERIRKAEEIYSRRNGQNIRSSVNKKEKKPERLKRTKKLFMQIFICLVIYIAFYAFTNKEYVFSEEFRNNIQEKINSINIEQTYQTVKSYIENIFGIKEQLQTENIVQETENVENTENDVQEETNAIEVQNDENIGGAEEENIENSLSNEEESIDEQTQMEKDAEDIKSKISFINPIEGTISSTFGWRTPTTSTVPKYHTGLDIAATTGTVIKSATDGEVILASSEGDYGNHYKIQIDDVIIIYAHCDILYLKEGDKVKQGDEIGEVGSTGNSTGPHLHFEIRKEDRLVDPQLILNI